jgi:hypothetical protein
LTYKGKVTGSRCNEILWFDLQKEEVLKLREYVCKNDRETWREKRERVKVKN